MARMGTLLLVDDSQSDIDLLLRAFKQLGVNNPMVICHGGREAIEYLSNEANARPALVLLDIKMPGTDGFAVLKWIKAHPKLKDLIVIVLTTSADLHDIQR